MILRLLAVLRADPTMYYCVPCGWWYPSTHSH